MTTLDATAPRHIRLVVIDDHTLFRRGITALLSRVPGFEVVGEAADGFEGIKVVAAKKPDVVLLDLNMPGAVHGDAIIRPISLYAPVIVITATIDLDVARRTLREGAMDFISKPFDFERLRAIVEAAIAMGGR